ncbi:MAG: Rv3654c family TadE-like protein [Mycobacteriales bacterium]
MIGETARGRRPSDDGSGTIWVLAITLIVVVCGLIGMYRGLAVVARHRAEAAADFAALAAAGSVIEGESVACGRAATIAAANGARVLSCRIDGTDAFVSAAVAVSSVVPGRFTAVGRARAGPAPSGGR